MAVFEPVELEGTTVNRASIHNVSVAENLKLGIGDKIEVYKANMIIPQIARNLTGSGLTTVPKQCPVCNENTEIKEDNGFKFLYCINPLCPAKAIKKYTHFAGRNAMNIDGLSEETLEKFVDSGYINEFADIYKIDKYEDEIVNTKGFGKRSFDKFMEAINKSRNTEGYRVLYGLGIFNVGATNAKMLCRELGGLDKVVTATKDDLLSIEGVGDIIADSVINYFNDEKNLLEFNNLLKEINIKEEVQITNNDGFISGKTFVITGSLNHYENRDALKLYIENNGGKVTGSVTKKTDYLINNDSMSSSSKNKKAKELNIPIITEEEFMKYADVEN